MALSFNGSNQYVAFNQHSIFNSSTITMCGWVSPTSLPTGMSVICSTNSVSAGYRAPFAMYFTGGRLAAQLTFQSAFLIFVTYDTVLVTSPNVTPLGSWIHVAFTFDGSVMRLYENGRQVAQTVTNRAPVPAVTATVGADRTGANSFQGFYSGVLEDFRMYNRALSANEILTISTLRGKDGIILNNVAQLSLNDMPNNTGMPSTQPVFNLTKNAVVGMASGSPIFRDSFVNTVKRW